MAYAAGYVPSITVLGVVAGKLFSRNLVAARIGGFSESSLYQYSQLLTGWLGHLYCHRWLPSVLFSPRFCVHMHVLSLSR
jgi:hypothetical protein